jgi:hypothetical protein
MNVVIKWNKQAVQQLQAAIEYFLNFLPIYNN